MAIEDYKDIVATCAMVSTMAHMLSGTLICKDIYKNGSSKGFDVFPFTAGVGMCVLMLRYALILNDSTMIIVNLFGTVINLLYLTFYYLYSVTEDLKKGVISLTGKISALVLVLLAYTCFENEANLEFRYGIIVTILFMIVIAAPLCNLAEVIRTQSTAMLPFPLIFMGTIVFFQWFLYGLIIKDNFIIFQNGVNLTLSAIQLSLFAIYPSKPKSAKKSD